MDAQLEQYQELLEVDSKVSAISKSILNGVFVTRGLTKQEPSDLSDVLTFVGSVVEGCVTPRMFTASIASVEMDIMVRLVTASDPSCLVPVPHKPAMFKLLRERLETLGPYGEYENLQRSAGGEGTGNTSAHVSGLAVKRWIEDLATPRDSEPDRLVGPISSQIFGSKQDNYYIANSIEFNGPSTSSFWELKHEEETVISASLDGVAYVQLDFWPMQASAWASRERFWPPPSLVKDAMSQGCQLVPKPEKGWGAGGVADVDHEEWRLTFTKAESVLAQGRTPLQNLVYVIAKSIFYCRLRLRNGDYEFSTYCLKTVMMRALEVIPTEQWQLDNAFHLVRELFTDLQECVNQRFLPYYFMPEVNLLVGYPTELLLEVQQELGVILSQEAWLWDPSAERVRAVTNKAGYLVHKLSELLAFFMVYHVKEFILSENERRNSNEQECVNLQSYEDTDLD